MRILLLPGLLGLTLALGGCGNRGPLYLPDAALPVPPPLSAVAPAPVLLPQ